MLVLRKESIYAFKCATAVLIYMMVLMNQTAWYLQWYLQASFLTFLVAVGPSVGQTNLTFVINLAGAIIGYTMAYLVLTAFGTGRNALNKVCYGWVGCDWGGSGTQYALWGASLVFAVPMIYVQLYTRLSVLGLLSLLSYSTSLIGSWANRNNPRFDNPWHRYYKLLASASMAITFALIFTLLVYPNLARHRLRLSISSILRRLNALYTHILSTAYAPTETSTPPISTSPSFLTTPMEDISTLLLELYRDLFSLEENMLFAAVEFRITGPFRWNTYKAILARLRGIHERLASAVSIIGDQGPFDPYLRKLLETSLRKSRRDLQTIIRLLLYIYSSSMVAKQPLPPDLPSASKARNHIFNTFWVYLADALTITLNASPRPVELDAAQRPVSITPQRSGDSTASLRPVSITPQRPGDSTASPRPVSMGSEVRMSLERPPRSGEVAALRMSRLVEEEEWEGSTLGVHAVGVGMDPEMLMGMVKSSSWLRYYSFAMTMKMLANEVDALGELFKDLFGELPGFTLPPIPGSPIAPPRSTLPRRATGRRGLDTEDDMYGMEDRDRVERVEGIPVTASEEAEEVKVEGGLKRRLTVLATSTL